MEVHIWPVVLLDALMYMMQCRLYYHHLPFERPLWCAKGDKIELESAKVNALRHITSGKTDKGLVSSSKK